MALQIFGTKKCPDTRKAERFFSERGVKYQLIDLAETGISPGELRSVREAVGADVLIDRDGERFKRRGLGYMDFDIEEEILADPLLLKSPIVRDGRKAAVGYRPEVWERWLEP
jgi:arsenate reductase-like glutaredoxin family protein